MCGFSGVQLFGAAGACSIFLFSFPFPFPFLYFFFFFFILVFYFYFCIMVYWGILELDQAQVHWVGLRCCLVFFFSFSFFNGHDALHHLEFCIFREIQDLCQRYTGARHTIKAGLRIHIGSWVNSMNLSHFF